MLDTKKSLLAKLFLSGIMLFSFLNIRCTPADDERKDVLASINEMSVTVSHFENAFKEYYYRTGQVLSQDLDTKKAILNTEFNTYVLAAYAKDLGIADEEFAKRKKEAIKRRVVNEEYLNQVILSTVSVNEEELQQYFVRFNTQLRASHIFARTEKEINEFYVRLKNGESFEALAREAFTNSYMAKNGGDIGRFTTDDLDIAFENAAFSLGLNEISEPIRTAQGYSIVKLTERVTKPILTEYDFAQKKPQLNSYVLKKKREIATRNHLNEFVKNVSVDEDHLDKLWSSIDQNYEGMLSKDPEFLSTLNFDGSLLASYEDFNFSLSDFGREYLISDIQMLNSIQDKSALKEFIIGVAYRSFLFKEAELSGIHEQSLVKDSIDETYYHFLAEEANRYLLGTIENTPAELYNEFTENQGDYVKPLEINLSRIVLNSKSEAEKVLKELEEGASFASLVQKYTVNNEDRFVNGELGLKSIKDFGFNSSQLSNLHIDEVSEIIQYQQNEYHIYKCIARIESRSMVFSEARDLVDGFLTEKKLRQLRASTLDQVKNKHQAEINIEKLKALTIQI